jgi:hypothetical protein
MRLCFRAAYFDKYNLSYSKIRSVKNTEKRRPNFLLSSIPQDKTLSVNKKLRYCHAFAFFGAILPKLPVLFIS